MWNVSPSLVRALVLALIAAVLPSLLLAQAQSETAGNCDLLVQVRTANEGSLNVPFQVDLHGAYGWLATVHIMGGEPAQFHVYNGRTYKLVVSGNGFETATTSYFEINALEMTHTETVHVKPQSEGSGGESRPGPSVSVSEMNIPKKASAEMKKGMDAYAKGDLDVATGHFEKAVAEYPHYARAYHMMGLIQIKGANRGKAKELFSKSIEADDAFLPAYLDLARIDLQDQNYTESESLLAKAVSVNPSLPDATALLASTEFANKEYDKALADVERTHALARHESFAEVHVMAGKVLAAQKHPNAAILQFQLFLMEKPDSPQAEDVRKIIASLTPAKQP